MGSRRLKKTQHHEETALALDYGDGNLEHGGWTADSSKVECIG
jgi:hypothetical protein